MKAGDLFDDWARKGRAEGMERGHGQTAAPLLHALPIETGSQFLDLGCGNGWAARWAQTQGALVCGIDASAEMVERAGTAAPEGDFRQGDFAALPWPANHFQFVWSMEAVYYAPDPDAVLHEVARVLAPGGSFHMLIDFYQENPDSHSWPSDVGVPMALRSEAEWIAAFEAAGLGAVHSKRLRATSPDADAWKREQGTLYVSGTAA